MNNIRDQLFEFLNSSSHNRWLHDDQMSVYVRKGNHCLGESIVGTIDIANVIVKEEFRGSGYFKEFMKDVEALGYSVYVENIFNDRLYHKLLFHGYTEDRQRCLVKKGRMTAPWQYRVYGD